MSWFDSLVKEDEWQEDILTKSPAVIAYEYYYLHKLLSEGAIDGANIKIKDIFEAVLKFLVLIILSKSLNEKNSMKYKEQVFLLMESLPSLGRWENVASFLCKESCNEPSPVYLLLNDIVNVYKKNKITHWRNESIGHGAYSNPDNEEFKKGLKERISLIQNHFKKYVDEYSSIVLEIKVGDEYHSLRGYNNARNTNYEGHDLYVRYNKERILLIPFIQCLDNGIYFYDSYIKNINKGNFLNYNDGNKVKRNDQILNTLYERVKKLCALSNVEDVAVNNMIINGNILKEVEKLNKPSKLLNLHFIREKIENIITIDNKGILLLQMEDGMGKTTFVKMMDQLAYNEKNFGKYIMCRAIYINSTYMHTKKMVIRKLQQALITMNSGDCLDGDGLPDIDLNSCNIKKQLGDYINVILNYYKMYECVEKLVIIIDGIDELSRKDREIFGIIPELEILPDNVYIIITARSDCQLNSFIKNELSKIKFTYKLNVTKNNMEYKKLICDVLTKNLNVDELCADKINDVMGGKLINLDIAIHAYQQYGNDDVFLKKSSMYKWMFDNIQRLYGDLYYQKIIKICVILSLAPVPISIEKLSMLLGENVISFTLVVYLNTLKSIINLNFNEEGATVEIERNEIKEIVLNNLAVCDKVIHGWVEDLNNISNNNIALEEDFHIWIIKLSSLDIEQWNNINNIENFFSYIIDHSQKLLDCEYYALRSLNDRMIEYLLRKDTMQLLLINCIAKLSIIFSMYDDYEYATNNLKRGISVVERRLRSRKKKAVLNFAYYSLSNLYSSLGCSSEKFNRAARNVSKTTKMLNDYRECSSILGRNNDRGLDVVEDLVKSCFVKAKHLARQNRHHEAVECVLHGEKELDCAKKSMYEKNMSDTYLYLKSMCNFLLSVYYEKFNPSECILRFKNAEVLAERCTDISTKNKKYMDLVFKNYRSYGHLARALHRMGDIEGALKVHEKIEKLVTQAEMKGERLFAHDLSQIYLDRGDIEMGTIGDCEKAVKYYTKVIELYNKFHKVIKGFDNQACRWALECRSIAYSKLGEDDKAKKDMEERKRKFKEPIDEKNLGGWKIKIDMSSNK